GTLHSTSALATGTAKACGSLQGGHAFAVTVAERLIERASAKAWHPRVKARCKGRKESFLPRWAELLDDVAVGVGLMRTFGSQERLAAAWQPAQQAGTQFQSGCHHDAHQSRRMWKAEAV